MSLEIRTEAYSTTAATMAALDLIPVLALDLILTPVLAPVRIPVLALDLILTPVLALVRIPVLALDLILTPVLALVRIPVLALDLILTPVLALVRTPARIPTRPNSSCVRGHSTGTYPMG
ncbi:MAG: hypothetical protein WC204_03580 [Elusimicrobiales bacterium]|jgi:hypothetical protein